MKDLKNIYMYISYMVYSSNCNDALYVTDEALVVVVSVKPELHNVSLRNYQRQILSTDCLCAVSLILKKEKKKRELRYVF